MQNATKSVFVFLLLLAFSGCNKRIDPGHVGIVVDLYGKDRGVQDYTATTGSVWYNPFTTSILQYPTFVQTAVWTANTAEGKPVNEEITFTTADSLQVSADISIAYSLQRQRVPEFYVKFRSDDLDAFTHGFLRNLAREKFDSAAGHYKIDQIMGDNAPFLTEARAALQAQLDPVGVHIEQFGFIGAPRPPKVVIDAINAKVQASQIALQKQTELIQAEADAKKSVAAAQGQANAQAALAEGQARANDALTRSITPVLLEWKRLQIQERWNGALPQYMVGSGSVPFFQIPPTK